MEYYEVGWGSQPGSYNEVGGGNVPGAYYERGQWPVRVDGTMSTRCLYQGYLRKTVGLGGFTARGAIS